jgi:hypothetical protein
MAPPSAGGVVVIAPPSAAGGVVVMAPPSAAGAAASVAAGAVASVATVMGFLGRAAWLLDLFSHFRVQYLIVLAALGFTLLLAKRRRMAALFLLLACANLPVVAPLYFGGQEKPPQGADRLRAMLINVHTKLGDPQRVGQVVRDEVTVHAPGRRDGGCCLAM